MDWDFSLIAFVAALVALARAWGLPTRLNALQDELEQRKSDQARLYAELQRLRSQVAELREASVESNPPPPPARPAAVPVPPARPAVSPAPVVPTSVVPVGPVVEPPVSIEIPASIVPPVLVPVVGPVEIVMPPAPIPAEPVLPVAEPIVAIQAPETVAATPASVPELVPVPTPEPPVAAPRLAPPPPPRPPVPPRRPVPVPEPEPTGPTFWERASTILLENWTGILGAVVLVTGVGFLGIYTALKVAPPVRFLMICAFAGALLGVRFALREKAFAKKLNAWLVSSAAAIFLFACVGAVSIPGLRWAVPPFDYLLLLAGVAANLYLAWRTSREEVATLHGVLSLVALAVLPPTAITLGAAAGVTVFSIAITYRQQWKYQLLLSIASFFAFHVYWHQELEAISEGLRLTAMGLVLLVGVAAAVVQYRSVYARRRFEPLLFAAHVLNWTCLGINLYLYSQGSIYKTIPLALGAGLTFWAGRRAKQLGIGWLFQTDTIISFILALATALSLQGWHATVPVILLFMLLEALLIALIMARQREVLVYRVAMAGALLAGAGLLLATSVYLPHGLPFALTHDAPVLALAGWAGLAFAQLLYGQPLLKKTDREDVEAPTNTSHRYLLGAFVGLAGLLQAGTGILLLRVLFAWHEAPVVLILLALVGLAAGAVGLATWVRRRALAPGWVRWQQLGLGQFLVVLALVGLHELHLSWSAVLLLIFLENLLVLLLLAGRAEDDLLHQQVYRAALVEALLAGTLLLLVASSHVVDGAPSVLYREALVLALAGWAGIVFVQLALRFPLLRAVKPMLGQLSSQPLANAKLHPEALSGFGGLAGLLQVGAGLLLARALFSWPGVPVYGLLGALGVLAGAALGLAAWMQAWGLAPGWVRRQQLVLGQFFVVLAIFGLHKLGLSWPGVLLLLFAENLLVALLLSGRDEEDLRHTQTYLLVLQALLLPVLVRYTSPNALVLTPLLRAGLLLGAALLTLGYQARRLTGRFREVEFAGLPFGDAYRLPVLGLAIGWLVLGAASLQFRELWSGWALVALLGALLTLRQRAAVPGLWAGLVLAGAGFLALQWSHALAPLLSSAPNYRVRDVLLYLLPTLAVPVAGLLYSWWPAAERFVRGPWLYLLGAHLVVVLVTTVPEGHVAYLMLGLLALASAAFVAAQAWRRALPTAEAVARAGQPDRYLLHLGYLLLAGSLGAHLYLFDLYETFFGQPAEYFTAAALFGALAAVAVTRPPATMPVYTSWRVLHRWLPEATLLFGTLTLAHNLRAPWLPLLWVSVALVLSYSAAFVPAHFRRVGLYGRLYYLLAALTAGANCLLNISPSELLTPEWWALVAAVALLFGYVGLALQVGNAPFAGLSPAWALLAQPTRRQLEAWLLYPAFTALSLLFIQSFDRSVLTVLLMLEVVAVFSTSLLLRRQDLRYVSLAGMLGCLVRLVFFDLSQSGTITRAIVFIFMGLLLLGMNALYARFKSRFAGPDLPEDNREGAASEPPEEPESEAV